MYVEAASVSSRIGLGVGAEGVVALPVVVLAGVVAAGVVVVLVGVGSGVVVCVGLSAPVEGVGTAAGSFGGLIVLDGSPSVEPVLPVGVGGVGVGVVVGVLSVDGGVVVGGATCAISTCGGGFTGVRLSAAYAAVPAPASRIAPTAPISASGRQSRSEASVPGAPAPHCKHHS